MSTLISTGNSDGSTGRCDSKCHDANEPICTCCCGGANHGVGFAQAQANTEILAQELIETATCDLNLRVHDVQLPLFAKDPS